MAGTSSPGSRSAYKTVGRFVLIAAACTLVMLVTVFWPQVTMLDRMELRTVDWRFHMRGPLQPHPDIVLVTVDEASLDKVGKWPWPRQLFARLTRQLTAAGARAIVYDVFFIEPEPDPAGDEAFAQAVASTDNVYLAGFAAGPEQAGDYGPDLNVREMAPAGQAEMLRHWAWNKATVTRGEGLLRWAGVYQLPDLTYPFARLARPAAGLGYTCLVQGADGIFRYTPPLGYFRQQLYPSLPLAVAAGLVGVRPSQVTVHYGHSLRLGDQHTVPLDRWGRMVINFAGRHNTYPHLPAWQILDESRDAAELELEDKVAIVAITAQGLHDVRATPFGGLLAGGEIQATILDNILTQRFLIQAPPEKILLILPFIGLAIALIFALLPTRQALVLALGVVAAYDWFSIWAFAHWSLIVPMFTPTLAGLVTVLVLVSYRLLLEEKQRSQARETLGHFVPTQIVSQLMEDEAAQILQGQRRIVSCLFCDLRGFTAASEQLSPEATVNLLNRYFTLMHEVIWEFDGTLDKLMGDGLMAFFNAPLEQPDHARRAVQAAIEMQRRIEFNRAEWEFCGWGELAAGIGISTGPAVVGYITARDRMQYTAIGAQVNLAARLEELTRELDVRILISDDTWQLVKDTVTTNDEGSVQVRGFTEQVNVYSVPVPLA